MEGEMGAKPIEVTCPAQFDITQVGEFYPQLVQALAQISAGDGELFLDAKAVERVDGAALQLLCAFFRQAEQDGTSVSWSGASAVVADAARSLGLGDCLQIPPVH
jgi:anti-anti-sigma regulatory factor